ncbi:MAG: class I SAM-dependent methyltransferase [bacterium]|nr:class I SAM-dependent methyltransferase [bacterium]
MKTNKLIWNERFKGKAQSKYPCELLISFLATNYSSYLRKNKIKILELGCGNGSNLWMVAKEGFRAYGLDFSKNAIKLCRKKLRDWRVEADLKVADMKKIPYPDNQFDAIFDIRSMQYLNLAEHKEAYQEVIRCLKPGGNFFQVHVGADSTPFAVKKGKKIDDCTLENISDQKMTLYGTGSTCFLKVSLISRLLKAASFTGINVEIYTRTYKNRSQIKEYLIVKCGK